MCWCLVKIQRYSKYVTQHTVSVYLFVYVYLYCLYVLESNWAKAMIYHDDKHVFNTLHLIHEEPVLPHLSTAPISPR